MTASVNSDRDEILLLAAYNIDHTRICGCNSSFRITHKIIEMLFLTMKKCGKLWHLSVLWSLLFNTKAIISPVNVCASLKKKKINSKYEILTPLIWMIGKSTCFRNLRVFFINQFLNFIMTVKVVISEKFSSLNQKSFLNVTKILHCKFLNKIEKYLLKFVYSCGCTRLYLFTLSIYISL